MSERPWLREGVRVASIAPRHGMQLAKVDYAHVSKIGKRDVVLTNGERFNVDTLSRSEGDWGRSVRLVPADDPDCARFAAERDHDKQVSQAKRACDEFSRGRLGALKTIAALAPLTDRAALFAELIKNGTAL